MSINIQNDFNNYFEMVQLKAIASPFYTDVQKQFEEGKIDASTYATIITSFHSDTLKEALNIANNMSIGIRELELKVNESVANVALVNRRKTALDEENYLRGREVTSRILLEQKKTQLENARIALVVRQTSGFNDNLRIKRSEHSAGLYGMIESGGNSSPDNLVNFTMSSLSSI